jgi:hypothetical protein
MSSELLGSAENALKGNLGGAWDILSGYADAYTDLGIGKKFGGAAAAYSLRDVGAMNGPVVRVRRDSDNAEQDFSALAVPYIPEWCNRQVIKPLDVRELNSGGSGNRDGNFVIAKAAYSLRSLGDRQATIANDAAPLNADTVVPASGKYVVQVRRNVDGTIKSFTADEVTDGTLVSFVNESFTSSLPLDVQGSAAAAYSLRNLSSTYSGPVVNVRRSSDDTTRDFTADSITNGDLVTFVNEIQTLGTVTNSVGNNGFTLTNASSTGFTATLSSGVGVCGWGFTAKSGDKITVSFDAVVRSGSPQFLPRKATALSSDNLNNVTSDSPLAIPSTGSYSFEFTYDDNDAGSLTFSEGDTPSDFDISNFQVTAFKGAGHVATWYDQSGNDNHATQGTADSQPKIVNNGSLVTGGINFDGTDDNLALSSTLGITSVASHFAVINPNGGGADTLFDNRDSSTDGYRIEATSSTKINFDWLSSDAEIDTVSDEGVYYFNKTSSQVQSGVNSGTLVTSSESGSVSVTTVPKIGSRSFSSVLNFFEGTVNELIVYGSDQSEKRRAIEESIATNYSVTLASFSRDGMVRTWYDQSVSDQGSTATGNHAVQTTADNQPKIVNNGSYLGEVDFDGTNDFLDLTSALGITNQGAVFTVAESGGGNDTLILDNRDNATDGFRVFRFGDAFEYRWQSATVDTGTNPSSDTKFIGFANHDTSNASAAVNGATATAVSDTSSINVTATPRIGARSFTSAAKFWDGTINELIVYDTDQTDNRGAFEANMAEHYNISGIPAEDNEVNGFVETWYDQSGNGNDAVQATAGSQPIIVSSGVLEDGIKFAASNDGSSPDILQVATRLGTTTDHFVTTVISKYQTAATVFGGIISTRKSNAGFAYGISGSSKVQSFFYASSGNANSSATAALANDCPRTLLSFDKDGDTLTGFTNGATNGISLSQGFDTPSTTLTNIGVSGSVDSPSSTGLQCNIDELIVYETDQATDQSNIESNIANHYGITLS